MSRFRHEYKYQLDPRQEAILRIKMEAVLVRDPYARTDGTYLVRSAYFDDMDNTCLRENADGTDLRSKFRMRYYNNNPGRIQLEKKSKCKGMCLKETCALTQEECGVFLRGGIPPPGEDETRRRLFAEVMMRGLRPVCIVTYERIPLVYPGGNVRITIDRNLSSSEDLECFLSGNYSTRPVFPVGQSLMEVKWDELLPRHIRDAMQMEELQWTAFSKYYHCRMIHQ